MQILENQIIKLRPLEPEDIETLYRWENDPSIWRLSNTITPFSKDILSKFIKSAHLDIYQNKQFRFMIESIKEPGKVVGTIDLFEFDPHHSRIGVGILIKEEKDRQKGYAKNAIQVLLKYCFEILMVHQVFCNISAANEVSLNLFKNLGFEVSGNKKEWIKTPAGYLDEWILQFINPSHSTH
ncbi:GNAT family N-acetyltransferase [Bacteroidota bacterium]